MLIQSPLGCAILLTNFVSCVETALKDFSELANWVVEGVEQVNKRDSEMTGQYDFVDD